MRFHTLNDWLEWQATLHPAEIELGLERVARVWRDMSPPAINCPVISVAGTNGKGSSIAMLQAIYLAAGYRVGSYTSPHLYCYNERICIDGKPVADDAIMNAFERVDEARQKTSLTYFEFGTLAALDIFARTELDVILLEVGLGGRLDAVNIIDADVALITSIELDHQSWLGDTRDAIAREKAGILRPNKACVISDPTTPSVIEEQAKSMECACYVARQDYQFEFEQNQWRWQSKDRIRAALPLPALTGQQQLQNAAGVLMVLELLQSLLPVNQQVIRDGLVTASMPGRFEIRQIREGEVTLILDVAHNPAAAVSLAESIKTCCGTKRILCLFSILADKDVAGVIGPLIPYVRQWHLAPVTSARGMPVDGTAEEVRRQLATQETRLLDETQVVCHQSVSEGLSSVRKMACPGDVILVYGSFYTVAEVGLEPV